MKHLLSRLLRTPELVRCLFTASNNREVVRAYVSRRNDAFPLTVRFRNGSFLDIDDWDELTTVWHVCFGNEYLIPGNARTIVDFGANIGAFAVWVSRKMPQAHVYSVEPFPSTFSRLVDHVQRNHLDARVTCLQAAISSVDGTVRFDATEGKRSYCRTIVSDESTTSAITVPSLRLSSFLDQMGLGQLDVLKMDVEGAEYDILLSSDKKTLNRISCITMEYHEASRAGILWQHLESNGFRRVRFVPGEWSGLATFVRS